MNSESLEFFPPVKLKTTPIKEIVESSMEIVDSDVRRLFELFLDEYPQAARIHFQTFQPEDAFDAGGYYELMPDGNQVIPTIFVSRGTHEGLSPLLDIRKTSVEMNARLLGIQPEQMTTKLLHRFILTHELGHIIDFLKNYLPDQESSFDAADEMSLHRESEKSMLPVPGMSPNDLGRKLSLLHSFQQALEKFPEIRRHPNFLQMQTLEDLLTFQEEAYRATSQERYADYFAANFLRTHAKDLGFSELSVPDEESFNQAA